MSLDAALDRAGVDDASRRLAVERMQELGYLDDARFAHRRADALAGRGAGDAKIEHDLERHGVEAEVAAAALASLEPERDRAARIVARRGSSVATARLLASRGFSAEAIGAVVADLEEGRLG